MQTTAGISCQENGSPETESGRIPLILIHGAGGSALHWPPDVRRMPGHWVFGLDLPGHGDSEGEGQSTIEGYVDRLRTWLDAKEIERAVWVGHSMGGGISLTAALSIPDRVAGLVLVGTGGRLRVHPSILEATAQPETFRGAVDLIISWAFSPHASTSLTAQVAKRMADTTPHVLHNDFRACDRFDVMQRLHEIDVPALVICGQDDKLTPPKYSEHLAEQIPNADLELIDHAGHMVMLEKPEQVAQAIRRFMGQLIAEK
jgi:pimeloyl-ACP methyl ester carboxylesterase